MHRQERVIVDEDEDAMLGLVFMHKNGDLKEVDHAKLLRAYDIHLTKLSRKWNYQSLLRRCREIADELLSRPTVEYDRRWAPDLLSALNEVADFVTDYIIEPDVQRLATVRPLLESGLKILDAINEFEKSEIPIGPKAEEKRQLIVQTSRRGKEATRKALSDGYQQFPHEQRIKTAWDSFLSACYWLEWIDLRPDGTAANPIVIDSEESPYSSETFDRPREDSESSEFSEFSDIFSDVDSDSSKSSA